MTAKTCDYKFEATLGAGSFGSVHLVRKRQGGKTFVIKEQNVVGEMAKSSWEMAVSEVRCLKKMRHPNIITYHDAWNEENRFYILMEYATRGTLKDLLDRRRKPLSNEDSLYLFSQVALGVHHIHSRGILHRDLKPENVMLTGRLGEVVKIGDFGVSKNIREQSGVKLAGSYYFMAPEMLRGEPDCDFKSDIWSIGAILYWMVTYELPFQATALKDLIDAVCSSRIRPFELPICTEVVNLVSKMLRNNPTHRPSAAQLLLCPFLVPFVIRHHINLGRVALPRHRHQTDPISSYLKNLK
ncbi:serine/threonine-protein kinase Nek3-like [Athalia rosae]|uniref:serine/threonine-protein kinase Nek3-like n=1 Tax=Athalia rosae TaxID=37344 RepID=UPI0020336D62|nr:serine/threonine-protein kinase Nek3-like [Athalia rosae]